MFSISFIYGHPVLSQRKQVWDDLELLANQAAPKWLCIGDFNQVLTEEDKFTFKPKPIPSNFDLQQTLSHLSLAPIESKGLSHTWMNKRKVDHFVMEKLDRAIGSIAWLETNPHYLVKNLPILCSDHGPILLDTECRPPFKHCTFCFKWMWTSHPECAKLIEKTWNTVAHSRSHAFCLKHKLDTIKTTFRAWNKTSFGKMEQTIEAKKDELRSIQEQLSTIEYVKKEREVREQLEDLLNREQIL